MLYRYQCDPSMKMLLQQTKTENKNLAFNQSSPKTRLEGRNTIDAADWIFAYSWRRISRNFRNKRYSTFALQNEHLKSYTRDRHKRPRIERRSSNRSPHRQLTKFIENIDNLYRTPTIRRLDSAWATFGLNVHRKLPECDTVVCSGNKLPIYTYFHISTEKHFI